MKNLLNTLFLSIQLKFKPLVVKLRLLFTASFWRVTVTEKLRTFFIKLFNVKPKDKNDYYTLAWWMISKKLAFAIIIALGVVALVYIIMMSPVMGVIDKFEKNGTAVVTYNYNSLPLKFHTGQVNILGEGKYLAYSGAVADGFAKGEGTLYDKNGNVVYTGAFDKSMYNGNGIYYYSSGTPQYKGEFVDNVYNGKGVFYNPNGSIQYSGDFALGKRSGKGELFNDNGNRVYGGTFSSGRILYEEFIGKPTAEIASLYSGKSVVYVSDDEFAVDMVELGVVYDTNEAVKSLENKATVTDVYVYTDKFSASNGKDINTINGLTATFGEPMYSGSTYITLPEAVAINALKEESRPTGKIDITSTSTFDDVHNVTEYNNNVEVYIYTYTAGTLTYTFYCENSTSTFFMYAIR